MKEQLEEIRRRALAELTDDAGEAQIDAVRVRVLGRSGELTEIMRKMREVPNEERPVIGQLVNEIKRQVEARIEALSERLKAASLEKSLNEKRLDVTLPGMRIARGRIHPITDIQERMLQIFEAMGFEVAMTQDLEDDFHNFEALNFKEHHPARDMLDTFYVEGGSLLRTHTSNGQIRVMEKRRPPLAVVCPGRCYRRDDLSVRASPMFTQIEGFMVDKRGRITMAHLKGVLSEFVRAFFGATAVRFRASYFPFTEPSAELDMHCLLCDGAGCPVCKHSGWTEVLGCGMIHPNVLRAVEYNPGEYAGFAFGMGVERTGLLKLGVDDMRLFFENDLRFLSQFPALSGGVR
ncbi:MAG TPA: phenylalanine--tRNA ligase subunit alpha [Candidatus Acidoferrales bacterium]|nr:phenylalanine--tRNA ligase subunit alpha [Candidatus Acidoferrales bacterium]